MSTYPLSLKSVQIRLVCQPCSESALASVAMDACTASCHGCPYFRWVLALVSKGFVFLRRVDSVALLVQCISRFPGCSWFPLHPGCAPLQLRLSFLLLDAVMLGALLLICCLSPYTDTRNPQTAQATLWLQMLSTYLHRRPLMLASLMST